MQQLTRFVMILALAGSLPVTAAQQPDNPMLAQQLRALKQSTLLTAQPTVAKQYQYHIDCHRDPAALKTMLEGRTQLAQQVTFTLSGQCLGPLHIRRSGIELAGHPDGSGSLLVEPQNNAAHAITVETGTARLSNLHVEVPAGTSAVMVLANATAYLDNITTNAQHPTLPGALFPHINIRGNSSVFASNLRGLTLLVSGNSYAEFHQGNRGLKMSVSDTSMAFSAAGGQFDAVDVAGNAYFRADNQSRVELLMIWSKAAAVAVNQSSVGELQMGGQTLFAAYQDSEITGPYSLHGNVVFELDHSTAYGWNKQDNPYSIIEGNNATVNGTFYPDWSWKGKDGTALKTH